MGGGGGGEGGRPHLEFLKTFCVANSSCYNLSLVIDTFDSHSPRVYIPLSTLPLLPIYARRPSPSPTPPSHPLLLFPSHLYIPQPFLSPPSIRIPSLSPHSSFPPLLFPSPPTLPLPPSIRIPPPLSLYSPLPSYVVDTCIPQEQICGASYAEESGIRQYSYLLAARYRQTASSTPSPKTSRSEGNSKRIAGKFQNRKIENEKIKNKTVIIKIKLFRTK